MGTTYTSGVHVHVHVHVHVWHTREWRTRVVCRVVNAWCPLTRMAYTYMSDVPASGVYVHEWGAVSSMQPHVCTAATACCSFTCVTYSSGVHVHGWRIRTRVTYPRVAHMYTSGVLCRPRSPTYVPMLPRAAAPRTSRTRVACPRVAHTRGALRHAPRLAQGVRVTCTCAACCRDGAALHPRGCHRCESGHVSVGVLTFSSV
jgi:hypothetical protein